MKENGVHEYVMRFTNY